MSFITKRERVFNEYDLFDLPARNEGKLKAYASCTDARAWSHFCSDKSEHLVEIIKRNNETCRPKYVPTDAIVNTLMAAKNAEIGRLKRKIEEFEQMLAAYDQLELTCDQKCEIADAHAAIRTANKELDELCLDLDLSGFTEGIDSEAFETGKSRGDEASIHTAHEVSKSKPNEWSYEKEPMPAMESKANQTTPTKPQDASTSAYDTRIDDLQEVIITKDAKLSAMQNTIAVMENDICEPYCIYAHIYTALEKIFGILCQNGKYKEYLDLLTAGKDTRGIDIKGKILFKLKVLEKFSMALIAPCTQEHSASQHAPECSCYHAQVIAHVETTFALTSPEIRNQNLDSKRALLVADIMENQEMKEILSKESISTKVYDDHIEDSLGVDSYSIDNENLNRLKNLQANYEDLLNCYENLKHEKNCLILRCKKYDDLENDFECLKSRLHEYNLLWNEKEHYRKRSEELDSLKEKFLVLSDETLNIETQLKAEAQMNFLKSKTVDELRTENIVLDKKLNDMTITFEKEKNVLTCKLKEYECKVMCQDQQIKSLSIQIDQLLDQDKIPSNIDSIKTLELTDQVESLKQQIKNLQNALFCDEEEKQQLQDQFNKKLELINDLRMDIEDWKNAYEREVQRHNLEKYTKYQDEIQVLKEENSTLSKDIEEKSSAIENLVTIIKNKSQEVSIIMEELEHTKNDNNDLLVQLQKCTDNFDKNISTLEFEKKTALISLQLARTDSQKLIKTQYEEGNNEQEMQATEMCLMNIVHRDNESSVLLQEIQKLREDNVTNISKLQEENTQNKKSLELLKKESSVLERKLLQFESLSQQFYNLKESHERLIVEKNRLENELHTKTFELDTVSHSYQLTQKESEDLMHRLRQSENLENEYIKLNNTYQKIYNDRSSLQHDLSDKEAQIHILSDSLNDLKIENERLRKQSDRVIKLEEELRNLRNAYETLIMDKNDLQNDYDDKMKEFDSLYNKLEHKIEENCELSNHIKSLQHNDMATKNNITALQNENVTIQSNLNTLKKESSVLIDKLQHLEEDMNHLKLAYEQVKLENLDLHKNVELKSVTIMKLQEENLDLHSQSKNLLTHNEDLERALINARQEHVSQTDAPEDLLSIRNEIEKMKQDKHAHQQKIKKLLDKLDESENIISNLSEDVLARDDKISILENYINELQDEVKRLHSALADITDSSEQIKEYSVQKINQSLKKMEAHHSKATHNMKLELAKLQNDNNTLENQLSTTKIKSEESFKDLRKYMSEITNLHNEREIIVTDIKQLELKSVGDSNLSPNNCTIEDIHTSIERIKFCLEKGHLKNNSLEKTLLKVKSSFQLVLNKADTEKKSIETEKQTLLNERDRAMIERQNMEEKLLQLKKKLEDQISHDKCLINDLEAEILNQNLIIDKINKSKEDYISKLEEEIQSLQNMYEASIKEVGELQNKIRSISEENSRNLSVIEETSVALQQKSKEIDVLKHTFNNLRHKSVQSVSTQAKITENTIRCNDISIQTINILEDEYEDENVLTNPIAIIGNINKEMNNINVNECTTDLKSDLLPKNEPYSVNEVQILRANVEPTFDCERNAYRENKIKRLNFGPMEQCSISSLSNLIEASAENSVLIDNQLRKDTRLKTQLSGRNDTENTTVIDVYNLQSLYINSSKYDDNDEEKSFELKPRGSMDLNSTNLSGVVDANDNITQQNLNNLQVYERSSEKNLFYIYNDSNSDTNPAAYETKFLNTRVPNIDKNEQLKNNLAQHYKNNKKLSQISSTTKTNDNKEKEIMKPKLQIDLPRANPVSSSAMTSEGDNRSLDSYTCAIYPSPIRPVNSDTNIKKIPSNSFCSKPGTLHNSFLDHKNDNVNEIKLSNIRNRSETNDEMPSQFHGSLLRVSSSVEASSHNIRSKINIPKQVPKIATHHKLSRVGANVLLIEYSNDKSTIDTISSHHNSDSQDTLRSVNFGLQYILDTMQCENDPQNIATYEALKPFVKKHCNEIPKNKNHNDKRAILSSSNSLSKTVENEINSYCYTPKLFKEDYQRSFNECGVLVKMDTEEDYEHKMQHHTKTLRENIEKDYKKKIDAMKVQYDSNIKNIINEHNQGVQSIQSLHEETLKDLLKIHENEVENLRTMSIEALRKVEKLEKENQTLKSKMQDNSTNALDEEPVKIPTHEMKRRKGRCRVDSKMLSKTNVEAFNVKPKSKTNGPCTCSVDVNISDTIRNIFEQVDAEQRKVAEYTYLKYIANKISMNNLEALDAQELSFLHLKVCRTWKTKLSKEEALQKRIDSLESELLNKQRQTQQHTELDRKVAEERRRLQEVREAVCRNSPEGSRDGSPEPIRPAVVITDNNTCSCNSAGCNLNANEIRSAGDLGPGLSGFLRTKRTKMENNRQAVLAKLDNDERKERKFYDDPPIRLKRSHDRPTSRKK